MEVGREPEEGEWRGERVEASVSSMCSNASARADHTQEQVGIHVCEVGIHVCLVVAVLIGIQISCPPLACRLC